MAVINVNGKALNHSADPRTPLLWVLREQLGLTVHVELPVHDRQSVPDGPLAPPEGPGHRRDPMTGEQQRDQITFERRERVFGAQPVEGRGRSLTLRLGREVDLPQRMSAGIRGDRSALHGRSYAQLIGIALDRSRYPLSRQDQTHV